MRDFNDDLRKELQDPEFATCFANAQQESLKELVKAGVITVANSTSMEMNKTKHLNWQALKEIAGVD